MVTVEKAIVRETSLARALLVLVCLLTISCVPIWMVDYPPLVDYPMHVARAYLLSLPQDGHGITEFYRANWQPLPNLGMDILVSQSMRFLEPMLAGKLFLCLIQFSLVSGGFAFSVALIKRVTVAAFLPALALFDQWFWMGFANYLFGVGLAFWGAAIWLWSDDWPKQRRTIVLAAIGVVLLVCHLMAFLVWIGLMAVLSLRGDQQRTKKVIAVCLGVCVLAYVALALTSRVPIRWDGRLNTLMSTCYPSLFGVVGLFLLVTVGFIDRTRPVGRALIGLTIFTFLGPSFLGGTAFACDRLSLPLLMLGLTTAVPRAGKVPAFSALLALCAITCLLKFSLWSSGAQSSKEMMAALEKVPERAVLASFDLGLRKSHTWQYQRHIPDWLLVHKPVFVAQNFAKKRQQPMVFAPAYEEWHQYQNNNPVELDSWTEVQSQLPKMLELQNRLNLETARLGMPPSQLYALVMHEQGQQGSVSGSTIVAEGKEFTLLKIEESASLR